MFDVHVRLMPQHMMELYSAVCNMVVGGGLSPSSPAVVPVEATPIHCAKSHDSADEDDGEGDSTYVARSESSNDLLNVGEREDYNTDGGVKFRVGHRFKNCDVVLMAVKNYSIQRNVEVRRFDGANTCLAPTMSQDYVQLDSSLICKVILLMIKTDPSVSIPVLQRGASELPFQALVLKGVDGKVESDCPDL
ncbi:hypothetical protein Ahy_A02g008295 [Arachis hypogaea]|uniref:Transposase MuDR plant domain-containing protein n=1 Tax=Arachis hypogaea TaxID=3818 RepID=A0A445EE42_ARAHY|nr:hypothetical protein Ahy_A02g008295 [Arachis hypogaea]